MRGLVDDREQQERINRSQDKISGVLEEFKETIVSLKDSKENLHSRVKDKKEECKELLSEIEKVEKHNKKLELELVQK